MSLRDSFKIAFRINGSIKAGSIKAAIVCAFVVMLSVACDGVSAQVGAPAQEAGETQAGEPKTEAAQPGADATPATEAEGAEAAPVETKKRKASDSFMRIRKDRKGRSVSLDTSITRYELTTADGKAVHVDLIGAVHIGEKEYFEQLNQEFEKYDALLYELVAPEGTVIPKGGRAEGASVLNPVAALQKGMQAVTELDFQLEHIDYTMKNFVHADMSPEEFGESMKKNGESIAGYVVKAMMQANLKGNRGKDPTVSLMMALVSKNRVWRIRRTMADQINDMESGMAMFEGKDGSTIIDHRNAKCMEILKREIAAGKTNIGIFYGAGHLMDMEKRLLSDFQATRGGQHWLTAWKLTGRVQED